MVDLKSLAEELLKQYLVDCLQDVVAVDLMEDDPECQLLDDSQWDRVAELIANADVNIRVVIH